MLVLLVILGSLKRFQDGKTVERVDRTRFGEKFEVEKSVCFGTG